MAAGWVQFLVPEPGCLVALSAAASPAPVASHAPAAVQPGVKKKGKISGELSQRAPN